MDSVIRHIYLKWNNFYFVHFLENKISQKLQSSQSDAFIVSRQNFEKPNEPENLNT